MGLGQRWDSRVSRVVLLFFLILGIATWLWPIGFGGMQPIGGDVTQFSMGLMAVLQDSIRSAQLPTWNDLWGFGYPGIGESQTGVYYPPHWILYGLFPLELAYTVSLVLHTLFAGLGAYWAARLFGASPGGAALSGFAWSCSGFFLIHLPHQWGYTVGSWMPWAWGLSWQILRKQGGWYTPFLLALVLALQILPGHFQLAFYTEVGILLMALVGWMPRARGSRWKGIGTLALVFASLAPLTAAQLIPTGRLARLASSSRDYEFMSAFSATPVHLVSYVAPYLFHRSPLWRPLAWDPLRTSPEENLGYIGLVPLFLALVGAIRGGWRDSASRTLVLLALVTTLLSLGPFVPGFAYLIQLPGFSFFRAPARWTLASSLALALLAGRGFDACRDWPRAGLGLAMFSLLSILAPLGILAGLELAFSNSAGDWLVKQTGQRNPGESEDSRAVPVAVNGRESKASLAERVVRKLRRVGREPQDDFRVLNALVREGLPWKSAADRTFLKSRFSIYKQELAFTFGLLTLLLLLAPLARKPLYFSMALLVFTGVDLVALGWNRYIDVGPMGSLERHSPVMARLRQLERGTRTADSLRNMPMVAGGAPMMAYRTLDLPSMSDLTALAMRPWERGQGDQERAAVAEALRLSGVGVRILEGQEASAMRAGMAKMMGWEIGDTLRDPVLAACLSSTAWVANQGEAASVFTLAYPREAPAQGWLIPLTSETKAAIVSDASSGPERNQAKLALETLQGATPVRFQRKSSTEFEFSLDLPGPSLLVLSQLPDPQWSARWVGSQGEVRVASIRRAFTNGNDVGWQSVETPGSGRWVLRMKYDARDVRVGLWVSAIAWLAGTAGFLYVLRAQRTANVVGS